MVQVLQPRRLENGERPWLSMLVDAMQTAARPELRAIPCDRSVLAEVSVQLGLPQAVYPQSASSFSFRN
jgi:hypothetical protein